MQHRTTRAILAGCALFALPMAAQADDVALEIAEAKPSIVSVGLALGASRFGSAHQTFYQATAVPSLALQLGHGVELVGALPASGGVARKSSCCRYGLGNATAGVRYHLSLGENASMSINGSASLPTTGSEDHEVRNGLYSATTQLTRDAGLYLPKTTTLRLGGTVRYSSRSFEASARAGTHAWLSRIEGEDDTSLVIPIAAQIGWKATPSLVPIAGLRAITKLGADAGFAAAVEAGLSYRRRVTSYRWFVSVPLDESSRKLGILSFVGALTWNI